ncbi:MipA/OmpV family protein, partial [Vibrio vulnificus]|nr:MipA/OmpV family protein [Vibrio vulnificus]
MKLRLVTILLLCFCLPVNAAISQWSLGVAASYSPAVYKDTPSN